MFWLELKFLLLPVGETPLIAPGCVIGPRLERILGVSDEIDVPEFRLTERTLLARAWDTALLPDDVGRRGFCWVWPDKPERCWPGGAPLTPDDGGAELSRI